MSGIVLPVRKVSKDAKDGSYKVVERRHQQWVPVSKSYHHSTSAFAALGRLVQKDTFEKLY